MSIEGSYIGMMQVDHDDTTAEAKLHTESFKLLLCYKVLRTYMAFQSVSSLSSSSDFTSCLAAEPRLMQNFVTNNLFSALHTHSKMFLSQSCSHATQTVATQVQGLFSFSPSNGTVIT